MTQALRRLALIVLALGAGTGCDDDGGTRTGATPGAAPGGDSPNVIVVMTDDQAIRTLRFMPKVRSALVQRGMEFRRSFATTPQCCPSRATFFTGQYSHNHEVFSSDAGYEALDDRANILPVWLQEAGYETAHVGKYINGYGIENPEEVPRGWSFWSALVDHTEYRMYGYTLNRNGSLRDYGSAPRDYQTDVLADEAVRFLNETGDDRPFFLSVAPAAPHSEGGLDDLPGGSRNPRPAPRHLGEFDSVPVPSPPSFGRSPDRAPEAIRRKVLRRAEKLDSETLRPAFLGRSESLLAVDDMVGRLLGTLREREELSDTYFIFTSDNGFLLGEHGLSGKTVPHEEAVRVPLVVRGPDVEPGTKTNELVANIDLAPTIAALAGAEPGRKQDGLSLTPLFDGGSLAPRDLALEYLSGREAFRAVRTERWMYAGYETGGSELYDMRADPFQLENLAGADRLMRVRRDLRRTAARLGECSGAACR